jgi:hypothetical protein
MYKNFIYLLKKYIKIICYKHINIYTNNLINLKKFI